MSILTKKPEMNKLKTILLITSCILITQISCKNKQPDIQRQAAAKKNPLVKVLQVTRGEMVSYIDITGTVEANISTEVKSPVDGIIDELHARENQRTVKDKIIAVINPNDRVSLISRNQLIVEALEKQILSTPQSTPDHDSLTSELLKARNNLSYAKNIYQTVPVICPLNGVVTYRWIEEGSQVSAKDRIVTISDLTSLVIKAEVNEKYFEAIAPGRKFTVVLNAYPSDSLTGIVSLVYPSVSSDSRSVKFDLKLQGFNKKLLPGMMAQLKIPVYRNDKAIIVHDDAILSSPDGRRFLFVVGSDTIAHQRIVKTGVTVNRQTEITEGLNKGEVIVTAGQETLKDNMKVSLPAALKNSK
jgi:RND family efflux transporter MFP subunit